MKTALGTLADILPKDPMKSIPPTVEQVKVSVPTQSDWKDATITFYRGDEPGDPYGDTTARPNQFGVSKAIEGSTVAVDPKVIPYGSIIEVMDKNGKIHRMVAHDTGSDVVKRTASKARGNDNPVLDIFTRGNATDMNDQFGEVAKWRLVQA